jgi:DNA-binding PadR family transcriptional regulator
MFKYRFPIHKIVTKMNGYEHHNRYGKEEGKWADDRGTRMHECRGRMGSDEGHMGSGPMRFRGLRPIVLDLISDSPKKGSEIMAAMEKTTEGRWKPSPGSIYPMLASMEEQGLIHKNADGRYSISESGKKEIEFHRKTMVGFRRRWMPDEPEDILSQINSYINYFNDIADDLSGQKSALAELKNRISGLIEKIPEEPADKNSQ